MSVRLSNLQSKLFVEHDWENSENALKLQNIMGLSSSECTTAAQLMLLIEYDSEIKQQLISFIENEISDSNDAGFMTSDLSAMIEFKWHLNYKPHFKTALHNVIHQQVTSMCDDEYSEAIYPQVEEWCSKLMKSLKRMTIGTDLETQTSRYLVDCFCKIRSNKLFEMISDWPDSMSAIEELKYGGTENIGLIGKKFRLVLQKRLLHLGASTSQILDFYISMIKALRVIDPSDVLLNYVAVPIRKYLKNRKDAVRSIVASLTEGKESELHGELKQGGSLEYGLDEDDEELGPGVNWEPRKKNKELTANVIDKNSIDGAKGLDILSLLVSIYGSTGLFMDEYKVMLGDKLLSNGKFSYEQEVATLELLKIRFGEIPLHPCEVMLKDIADSKRNNTAVHSEFKRLQTIKNAGTSSSVREDISNVLVTQISENYWPHIPKDGEDIVYHEKIEKLVGAYCESYTSLKKPRKLLPLKTMGHVDLTLHFDDGSSRDFITNPLQANLILHFGDSSSGPLSLSKLVTLCGDIEESDVQAALAYWIHKGVVRETASCGSSSSSSSYMEEETKYYEIVENQAALAELDSSTMEEDGLSDMNMRMNAIADAQKQAILQKTEGYVKGFLRGHKTMDLDGLYSLVKNSFNAEERFDMNMLELKQFLQKMVDQGVIEVLGSSYSLVK